MKIDFSGVDPEVRRGAARVRVPEGDYEVKIVDHSLVKDSDTQRTKGITWNVQITKGKYKGKKLRGFTSLKPEALWSLRNLIHAALGKNVAGKAVNFDPAMVYGKVVGGAVVDNEFTRNGKTVITSEVNTFFPADEVGDADEDEDEDEEDVEEDEDSEEEEEEEEDLEDVDVDDL
jgi:hypothetical protein